jgi:hypothetical protein
MKGLDVKVRTVRAGQPRAYADTEYVFEVSGTMETYFIGDKQFRPLDERYARRVVEALYGGPLPEKGPEWNWWETYTDYVRETSPGTWEVRIVQPSTD